MKNTDTTTDSRPAPQVTYEVNVTPGFGPDLTPTYRALIYRYVYAGVTGPFSAEPTFDSIADVDDWLARQGFTRTGQFGEVCANGFATAPVERI